MKTGLEKCVPLINSEMLFEARPPPGLGITPRPVVMIARQSGCGAQGVAEKLAAYLEAPAQESSWPWKVFDSNLVRKVLADHKLPRRFARFMSEDRASELSDTMDELLGMHPLAWTLVRHTTETILQLAHRGNVILIGRGANVVTKNLPGV